MMVKPHLKQISCLKQAFGVVLVEKRREEDMLRNLIYSFIIILLILLHQMHFTFHNVPQRVFLRFLSS